jgi:hypothetical protein
MFARALRTTPGAAYGDDHQDGDVGVWTDAHAPERQPASAMGSLAGWLELSHLPPETMQRHDRRRQKYGLCNIGFMSGVGAAGAIRQAT